MCDVVAALEGSEPTVREEDVGRKRANIARDGRDERCALYQYINATVAVVDFLWAYLYVVSGGCMMDDKVAHLATRCGD